MDMNRQLDIIDVFERNWPQAPKEQVNVIRRPSGDTWVWVAFSLDSINVCLGALIGTRNGIREELTVIDSSQPITVDRFVISGIRNLHRDGDGHLLGIRDMRRRVQDGGEDPIEVCREALLDTMNSMLGSPQESIATIRSLNPTSESVAAVTGGVGSLGKKN